MKVITAGGAIEIGTTETTPTVGIIDFSRRVTDDFGVTTVVERGFSRRMSVRLALPFDQVDGLQQRLADLRATSALWVADERYSWLSAEGYYKDFELDLATPPVSFCTLTVEGLAQTEVVPDAGGDPAPDEQVSTLQLLRPITVDDEVLVASNIAENDAPAWSASSTYPKGAIVVRGGKRFESLVAGNVGNEPVENGPVWLLLGPTNRWAMFDSALGTATAAGSIVVQLAAVGIDALALLDVQAATVRVQAPGYDRVQAGAPGTITFLDLPENAGPLVVTVAGPGQVSVGTLLIGKVEGLGITEASPTAGITDFSRKEVDDFGEVTIVQRAWAKRMSARALIRTDALDTVANRIAAVRARPSLWIGQAGLDTLTIFGFFKDFSIEVGESVSKLSLSIEGLSKAAPPAPPLTVNWPDVADTNPDRPRPEDGATVGSPPGTPTGDLDSQVVADALKAMAGAPTGEDVLAGAHALLERTLQTVDALKELVSAPDQTGLLDGAKALVDRLRTNQAAQLSAQLLGEARKQRTELLTHLDGIPVGTRVRQEITQRIEGDAAIVESIVELTAKTESDIGEVLAAIVEEATLRADADAAETSQRQAAISAVTGLINDETASREAAIIAEQQTRADAISAETAQRETAISTVTGLVGTEKAAREAAIVSERTTSATELAAETQQRQAAISTVTGLIGEETAARQAAITSEQQTRAGAISAETAQREAAISTVTGLVGTEKAAREAAIASEATTRADAISAETQQRETAISTVTGLVGTEKAAREAAIVSERTTSATELAAETQQRQAAISTVTGLIGEETAARQAAITSEQQTRAGAISAETQQRNVAISTVTGLISGEVADRIAAITSEATTRADAISAETALREAAIASVTALVNGERSAREAAIVNEQRARADDVGAIAQSIQSLGTTVDGQSASVQLLLETVNGETANAQLVTNVNGEITGFRINGQEGLFFIAADRFVVGGEGVFEVVGDQVRIKRLVIGAGNVGFDELLVASLVRRGFETSPGGIAQFLGTSTQLLSIPLGTINPGGTFTCKYVGAPPTKMLVDSQTTMNGKIAYLRYLDDGGLSISCVDPQGNSYAFDGTKYLDDRAVRATIPFSATFVATVRRGNVDTGWTDEGDYYIRYVSQQYSVGPIDVELTWRAL